MKPPRFDYLRPDSVAEAVAALAEYDDDAVVLAGGQSLIAMLNMRLVAPRLVVDISRLPELRDVRIDGDHLEVGAAVTQAELQRWAGLNECVPLIAAALPHVGHFQTRSRGTVCGSIAHADPSSELPLCFAALRGAAVLRSQSGVRRIPAGDFQTGLLSTARNSDELIVAVRFPLHRPGCGYAFNEVSLRHGDFAMIAVAVLADDAGIRLGVGGLADRPEVRNWPRFEDNDLDEALNALAWELAVDGDRFAPAPYRRELLRRVGRQTIEEALGADSQG